jgi:SAM-dependent methyltransferase
VTDPHGLNWRAWDDRYGRNDTGWDLGAPAPPIVSLLEQRREELRPGRILVVGCGRGHDALALAANGFDVIALDFAPAAVAAARARLAGARPRALVLRGDVRAIPLPGASVDYVLEHTCFCAIDPADRERYVVEVARVLRPRGRLFGLFYEPAAPGNPPFPVNDAELRERFAPAFEIEVLERAKGSIERRDGREWLAVFRRK